MVAVTRKEIQYDMANEKAIAARPIVVLLNKTLPIKNTTAAQINCGIRW
tara:strand:- start:1049 stop:1195 length:147 start_codon:yes stop_codon:yes gene_type:complete